MALWTDLVLSALYHYYLWFLTLLCGIYVPTTPDYFGAVSIPILDMTRTPLEAYKWASVMVFVGQINKSNSQKGNEGVWILKLLKFLHFKVLLV